MKKQTITERVKSEQESILAKAAAEIQKLIDVESDKAQAAAKASDEARKLNMWEASSSHIEALQKCWARRDALHEARLALFRVGAEQQIFLNM